METQNKLITEQKPISIGTITSSALTAAVIWSSNIELMVERAYSWLAKL